GRGTARRRGRSVSAGSRGARRSLPTAPPPDPCVAEPRGSTPAPRSADPPDHGPARWDGRPATPEAPPRSRTAPPETPWAKGAGPPPACRPAGVPAPSARGRAQLARGL